MPTRKRTKAKTGKTAKTAKGKRRVFCRDALEWLEKHKGWQAIVTSLPEMDEMGHNIDDYEVFFRRAARLCMEAVSEEGYCIFLQTDRKHRGWIDKSYWISDEAQKTGMRMIWHKVALRVGIGKADLYRPGYSHMLCYSKKGPIGIPTANVVERGPVLYSNGLGVDAVRHVLSYLSARGVTEVVDPFVGAGTVLAVAKEKGMNSVGVDIDPIQCKKARKAVLPSP